MGGIADFDPEAALGVWLERANRRSERHAVVLLAEADAAGEPSGDVTAAAQALGALLRHGDQIWIWRGEPNRAVILLTAVTDLPTAAEVTRRLLATLDPPGPVAGVTLLQPGEGIDSLLRRVEGAWLLATDGGDGQVATSPVLGRSSAP